MGPVIAEALSRTRIAIGSLEVVGPFEQRGWSVAGVLVPIGYTLWSLWLIALGVLLLVR